jgi:hypothetical protein
VSAPADVLTQALREQLDRETRRVTDSLRGLALERLTRPGGDGTTPADRARTCAQTLADLAADAAGRARRPVPRTQPHGSADQVAVTAHDVRDEGGDAQLDAALAALIALRRTL